VVHYLQLWCDRRSTNCEPCNESLTGNELVEHSDRHGKQQTAARFTSLIGTKRTWRSRPVISAIGRRANV